MRGRRLLQSTRRLAQVVLHTGATLSFGNPAARGGAQNVAFREASSAALSSSLQASLVLAKAAGLTALEFQISVFRKLLQPRQQKSPPTHTHASLCSGALWAKDQPSLSVSTTSPRARGFGSRHHGRVQPHGDLGCAVSCPGWHAARGAVPCPAASEPYANPPATGRDWSERERPGLVLNTAF